MLRRSLIYERVWGYDFGPDSHSLDVYIGYLRRKLEADGEPRLIQTVRGVGYALRGRAVSFGRGSRSLVGVAVGGGRGARRPSVAYVLVADQLRGQVDDTLRDAPAEVAPRAASARRRPAHRRAAAALRPRQRSGRTTPDVYLQAGDSAGEVARPGREAGELPVDDETVEVARAASGRLLRRRRRRGHPRPHAHRAGRRTASRCSSCGR